jgi:hypothetical protein
MHISQTIGDILLTVLITVVGGFFVIYAYPRVPGYLSRLFTLIAQTYEGFAASRHRALTRQLEQVRQLRADTTKHAGWVAANVGAIVVNFGLAIALQLALVAIVVLMALVAQGMRLKSLIGEAVAPEGPTVFGLDLRPYTIFVVVVGILVSVAAMVTAMVLQSKLETLRNLEEREGFLNRQIENLCARYPTLKSKTAPPPSRPK